MVSRKSLFCSDWKCIVVIVIKLVDVTSWASVTVNHQYEPLHKYLSTLTWVTVTDDIHIHLLMGNYDRLWLKQQQKSHLSEAIILFVATSLL